MPERLAKAGAPNKQSNLVEAVAALPGPRILNAAGPDLPSALSIARTISRHLSHRWNEVLLEVEHGEHGDHPWYAVYRIKADITSAQNLEYVPVRSYTHTLAT